MARKAKEVPESAQEARVETAVGMDTPEVKTVPEAAVGGQIVGPESETELLGCQDENEAKLTGEPLLAFAVTPKGGLRLRKEPSAESPVLAVLPCGTGVFSDGEPCPDGWIHVATGRLEGYMMAEHLEPLWS